MEVPVSKSQPEAGLLGQTLDGRYRIDEYIGGGGMGSVYHAVQIGALERDVAIKVINPIHSTNPQVVKRFESEARIIASLRHPNTLRLVDSGWLKDGRLFIVTDLLKGASLMDLLNQGPIEAARALRILRQVCDALHEAHSSGVVHRDLKPANIFVEVIAGQEVVKVLDFGIAKTQYFPTLTAPMHVIGTPGFMSPEQAQGRQMDGRSDIYALGAILFECLTSEPPFTSATLNPVELVMKHINDPVPAPSSRPAAVFVDPEIDDLTIAMLAKNPEDRPASAMRLRHRFDEILSRLEMGNTRVGPVGVFDLPDVKTEFVEHHLEISRPHFGDEVTDEGNSSFDSQERTIAETSDLDDTDDASPNKPSVIFAEDTQDTNEGEVLEDTAKSQDLIHDLALDPATDPERDSLSPRLVSAFPQPPIQAPLIPPSFSAVSTMRPSHPTGGIGVSQLDQAPPSRFTPTERRLIILSSLLAVLIAAMAVSLLAPDSPDSKVIQTQPLND